MDAIDALLGRFSCSKLGLPGPDPAQLALMQAAALRAPDHARLKPWRFLVVEGDGLQQLGEVLARLLQEDDPAATAETLARERQKPLRAPTVIVAIARIQSHPKVPAMEQVISAGCAVHAMALAAYALGLGAIWRTGPAASDTRLHAALGLQPGETVVGFLYVGTPEAGARAPERPQPRDFFQAWP